MTYHNAVKYLQQAPRDSRNPTALPIVWDALGAPQKSLKYLRLTGSNGKTICAEMLLSAFRESEYVVGSLSFPFFGDGRNNIRINSLPIPTEEFTQHAETVFQTIKMMNSAKKEEPAEASDQITLSQSELLLSMALLAFREHRCTFCLIESDASLSDPTLRLPAPFAAAICGTIPSEQKKEIQGIRSYIVHGIQEIVSAPQNQDAYRVISETCASINCRLTIPTKAELNISRLSLSGSEFTYKGETYKLGLCGKFQITNATVVLETINMLTRRGYALPKEQIFEGLWRTKIPSKFEILSVSPTIIVDSTHTESAIAAICESLADFQSILGKNLRLCLPDGNLTEEYLSALSPYGYSVKSALTYLETDKPKEIATNVLNSLERNETLLVSGPFVQTIKIRDEILKRLSQ